MSSAPRNSFVKAIKSKVIIAVLLACFALCMAWGVSRVVFKEMLNTVENISSPNERLRIVNIISRKIGTLDQLQRGQVFNNSENYRKGFKESRELRQVLDTLEGLYAGDSVQRVRIRSIKRLLNERDKQFVNYLKVRERLVNNKIFSEQVKNINSIVSLDTGQSESTVLATEEKTSTTTIYPTEEKSRGFFGKIFGRKKTDEDKSIKIVSEEKIRRDTISLSAEDKVAKNLEKSLQVIEHEQRKKNASFLNREAVLADANNRLVTQMYSVLRQVESEVVTQIGKNGSKAEEVVNTGIKTMGVIMLVFVVLTGLLLYLILTDITKSGKYRSELELARDEAEYHGRAKQRFLSNMSHEIRTPLQSIIGYADIIKDQEYPDHTHIEAIRHSSEHLLQIVNEILDYNRITSGKFVFVNKPFEMASLMEEVLSVMRPQAEFKALSLQSDFDFKGIKYINGDPFRLKQILYNLLGNAIKFTHKGEIMLSSSFKRKADSLYFTFVVKDTGIGLSEDECKRIFNEFEQGDLPQNEVNNSAGTGLGLNIIKSLVENQGGRIYVKSKVGVGSVFTVYLTFNEAKEPDKTTFQTTGSRISPGLVWVVDDDQLILDLCGIIFQRNEVLYRGFNSPSKLLKEEWDDSVKFVLMDIRMPEMDGIELCRTLREKVGPSVKIYAITAQVLPEERELLLESGFDGLLMKPFRESDLLSLISTDITPPVFEDIDLDLTSLKKMTYGDEDQLKKILIRFEEDCKNDSKLLLTALDDSDVDLVCLIVHRLAGRIAQIGSMQIASEFRTCEVELRKSSAITSQSRKDIQLLLQKLDWLLYSISYRSILL